MRRFCSFFSDLRKKSDNKARLMDWTRSVADFLLINGLSRITSTRTSPDVQPGRKRKKIVARLKWRSWERWSATTGLLSFSDTIRSMPLTVTPSWRFIWKLFRVTQLQLSWQGLLFLKDAMVSNKEQKWQFCPKIKNLLLPLCLGCSLRHSYKFPSHPNISSWV